MPEHSAIPRRLRAAALLLAVAGITVAVMPAQTYTVLYRFQGHTTDGQNPEGALFIDNLGNLYGTTVFGPGCTPQPCTASQGIVFELNTSLAESILHRFSTSSGGLNPYGGLVRDAARNAYGTTSLGGSADMGTVFTLTSHGAVPMHSFTGGSDGAFPYGGLVQDANTNLYGATSAGGSSNAGVIFKVTGGHESVLYTFTGKTDGGNPYSTLLRNSSSGTLFGTASTGGNIQNNCFPYGCGVVFTLNTSNKLRVLHTFTGSPNDGSNPYSGVITDSSGNLYGTTFNGGTGPCTNGCGVVYKIAKNGTETVLYNFQGYPNDGSFPYGGLVRDSAGNLYGTTTYGGSTDNGIVFKLDTSNHETVLYSFKGTTDGAVPRAGLILGSSGNLYGTTYNGGVTGVACGGSPQDSCGVIFKVVP